MSDLTGTVTFSLVDGGAVDESGFFGAEVLGPDSCLVCVFIVAVAGRLEFKNSKSISSSFLSEELDERLIFSDVDIFCSCLLAITVALANEAAEIKYILIKKTQST